MYILLIIYFLLFVFISVKNLKYGIYWLVFTLPAYLIRFEIFGLPTTLLEGEILLIFLIWFLKMLKYQNIKALKQKLVSKDLLLLYYFITLLLITSIVSIFVSPDFYVALGIWKAYFLEPILLFIVFVSVIKKQDLKNIFTVFSAQIFILSLFAIYQKLTGALITNPFWADEATRRVTSFFPYPNALALYIAPIFILLLGYLIGLFKKNRKFFVVLLLYHFITLILGFLAVCFTGSKGALFAIIAGLIFYTLFYKGKRKIFVGILIIIFITLLFYCFITRASIANILQGASTVEGGDSISTRLEMWSETWQMLKTKPIFGAGLAGYQTAVASFHAKDYIEVYLYPHNIFLNLWTEIGLPGLFAFIAIIMYFFIYGFKKSDNYSVIIMSSMVVLLAHGLVDVPYFKNDLSVLFWIILGFMIINIKYKKYEIEK
ncbi:MAG: O-antigen ligase family protein [Patescibacteria group bacterium]